MAAPPRGNTGYSVYFITASTFQKQCLFQSERLSLPFIDTLLHYRLQSCPTTSIWSSGRAATAIKTVLLAGGRWAVIVVLMSGSLFTALLMVH